MNIFNRRDFLATSAGLLAAPLLAADSPKPDFTFALCTDTHLGKPGADYVKRMRQTVAEINASPAELTIFCGDLVDSGETEARQKLYPEWVDIAKELKKEYTAVPGNHDPVEMFKKHIRKETEGVLEFKDYRFLTFADAEPNPGHLGVVTPEQIKWLQARLDEAKKKSQRVVLAAHVIYHENKHPDVGWYIKTGRAEFAKLLAANKQIVAFFGGHLHCGLRGWSDTFHGIHEVILPCVSYNRDRMLQNAPGFAIAESRPAWVLVDVFPTELVLKYKPVGADIAAEKKLALK
ncbi:MAG: metallophosphoesterase [Planctomycetes bacterium]|nr:metallophosphoesterase [Planctomycetota bacterium]